MIYYSIFDLIIDKAKEKNIKPDEVFSFFKNFKISKAKLLALRETSYIPEDIQFKTAITQFLNMSELEISLSMGKIPNEYKASYVKNISKIANILEKKTDHGPSQKITPFFTNTWGSLYKGDCISVMKQLPAEHFDLIFADPPFNLDKVYDPGINDNMSMTKYINWTQEWLDQCIRILKTGGRIFIYNLPKWCTYIAQYFNQRLTYWDWIAVDMKFSLPISHRLYPAHYALVSYIKGTKATTYHNQRIPLQTCRHCGGEIKDYGGYKSKMNPKGVNVSDVWTDIYPVRHKNSKNRKYNELSVKLLYRIISMATNEGDIVFDPFGGSGTTYAVAQMLKRKWVGTELGDCELIKHRLQNPQQDEANLAKILENENRLFTKKAEELRKEHGFWLCDDFERDKMTKKDSLKLFD